MMTLTLTLTLKVLSTQDVSELERAVAICPDATKTMNSAASQPADLAAGRHHAYYFHRRMDKSGDVYSFDEVFAPRPWQHRDRPAAVINGQQGYGTDSLSTLTRVPRLVETLSLIELMPLSQEGYQQLASDFLSWEKFISSRKGTIDQFKVEDVRSFTEIDQEEAIKKRVKAAYKLARAAKSKLRQKQRENE
jgi:hypothetical protein